jgi:ribosomal-protein-alanine N-acetyltransferase
MQTFIETERLLLREILSSDEQGMFELDSDPDVHQFLGNRPVKTIQESRELIQFIRQQYSDFGIGRWAVIEKATNKFIGWAGFKFTKEIINNHSDFYDLGYRFIKKYWGKGYATEVSKACIDYGFTKMNLHKIYARTMVGNIKSRKVLEKAGLSYVETFDLNGVAHVWYKIERADSISASPL